MASLYSINTSFPRFIFETNLYTYLDSKDDPNDFPVALTEEYIVQDISHVTAIDRGPAIARTAARLNQYFLIIANGHTTMLTPLYADISRRSGVNISGYFAAPVQLSYSQMKAIYDALEMMSTEYETSILQASVAHMDIAGRILDEDGGIGGSP